MAFLHPTDTFLLDNILGIRGFHKSRWSRRLTSCVGSNKMQQSEARGDDLAFGDFAISDKCKYIQLTCVLAFGLELLIFHNGVFDCGLSVRFRL